MLEAFITIKAFAFASPGLHITNSSSLHQQNLKFDFVYNITSSVWRNGLSVLKTTAFLVYPPHFSKFNCNPAPLNLETVNFQQSNVLCEACCFTVKRSPAVKYEMVLWLHACKYLFSQVLVISFDSLRRVNIVEIFTVREISRVMFHSYKLLYCIYIDFVF